MRLRRSPSTFWRRTRTVERFRRRSLRSPSRTATPRWCLVWSTEQSPSWSTGCLCFTWFIRWFGSPSTRGSAQMSTFRPYCFVE
ncbi:hypothetical protein OIY81_2175 [Cryptosporidium canis]|uniref:Uncharacterized protein n=1 Tax=Cryptosporidium canis TaxID=195482 RepID=A0ABQ8P9T5_9CRYT|nr:hypothetical protein OIY81_2175 [Cryptosporidium canis]KAJ1613968.1 hypothetical protein OJ252_827 [Cryptosporidium canis]